MPKSNTESMPETQVNPDPILEKRSRRTFDAEYKLRVLSEADQCKHGELGALLRREGLYSSQLATWRKEFSEQGVVGLAKSTPGPSPKLTAEQREIERLKKQNKRLERDLEIAHGCLDLQKKALTMLDQIKRSENDS